MRLALLLLGALLCVEAGAQTQTTIFRWADPDGRVSYSSEKPPAGAAARVVEERINAVIGVPAGALRPEARLYSNRWCDECRRAREYLERQGVDYSEVDIEGSGEAFAEFRALGGRRLPLIVVDGLRMSGFSERGLAQLLRAAGY